MYIAQGNPRRPNRRHAALQYCMAWAELPRGKSRGILGLLVGAGDLDLGVFEKNKREGIPRATTNHPESSVPRRRICLTRSNRDAYLGGPRHVDSYVCRIKPTSGQGADHFRNQRDFCF